MLPFQADVGGRFSLNATTVAGVNVPLFGMSEPDFIELRSITGWGELNDAQDFYWWWARGMSQNTAKGLAQSSAAIGSGAVTTNALTSSAISFFNSANPPTYATVTGTVTDGTTFVVTVTSSASFAVGDMVRLLNVTAMQQVAGVDFQVTAISDGTHITLGMMASAVTASAVTAMVNGSAVIVLKFIPGRFYPRKKFIAGITRAAQATVYFTAANDFTPGEMIGLRIPVEYGSGDWSNSNFLRKDYRVLSVTNSATVSSVVLDLDTSGFASAFSYPLSATAVSGISPAVAVPSSSGVIPYNGSATQPQIPEGTNLLDAFDNRNQYFVRFGVSLFSTSDVSDVWAWEARKFDDYRQYVF